ncbi:hypothetical protein GALL_530070 [mine drainage metagenome]|uniref:Uncharacterized protein n=1 Tax=mine drainage metagenome TaxID=410659 RepID=A0A1J5P2Z0_9ZZZZ
MQTRGASFLLIVASSQAKLTAKVVEPEPPARPWTGSTTPSRSLFPLNEGVATACASGTTARGCATGAG